MKGFERPGMDQTEEASVVETEEFSQGEELPENAILALGFPSDRLYLLSKTERYFVFTYVGNELRIKEGLIPDKLPTDADRSKKHGKDLWLAKDEIVDFRLIMKHSASTALPNNAVVKLTLRDGKRWTMILCAEEEKKYYLDFFSALQGRRSGEWNARKEERERRREDRRLAQERREEEFRREYRGKRTPNGNYLAAAACIGLLLLDIVLFFFSVITVTYRRMILTVSLLSMAAAWFLIWKYPMYFSLRDRKDALMTKVSERNNSMLMQVFFPGASMFIASLMGVHYDDIWRLLVIVGLGIGLEVWGFMVLVRKHRIKTSELVSMALLLVMFGGGVPMGVNLLLSDPEPSRIENNSVIEQRISEGKHHDYYYLTVVVENDGRDYDVSPSYYENVKVGDTVKVGFWDGGLWIPYSKVMEPDAS